MASPLGQLIAEAQDVIRGEPLVAHAERERLERLRDITARIAAYMATMPPNERPVDPRALEAAARAAASPQGETALLQLLYHLQEVARRPREPYPSTLQVSEEFTSQVAQAIAVGVITAVAVPLVLKWLGFGGG